MSNDSGIGGLLSEAGFSPSIHSISSVFGAPEGRLPHG
jgi:hypothetical protein